MTQRPSRESRELRSRLFTRSGPRLQSLPELVPVLDESALTQALELAQRMADGPGRDRLLHALALRLAELDDFRQALETAQAIRDPGQQAETLAALVPDLPESRLGQALAAALAIRDEPAQAQALSGLAPRLATALEQLLQPLPTAARESQLQAVLDAARRIETEEPLARAQALGHIAAHLPATRQEPLLEEALEMVLATPDEEAQAKALSALAGQLPARLLDEALAAAREIQNAADRQQAITALALQLPEEPREAAMREALEAVPRIIGPRARAQALAELVPHLPDSLLEETLNTARALRDPAGRAKTLRALADRMPAPSSQPLMAEAQAAELEIQDKGPGRRPGSAADQSRVRRLLDRMPAGERESLLQEMLAASADQVNQEAAERVVNTGFAPTDTPAQPLDPAMPLTPGTGYHFWLEVGEPVQESIEVTPVDIPEEHLPSEARLQVVLFPFDDELEIDSAADVGELQLDSDGAVRVVQQPAELPTPPPDPELLERRLFFPVRTPAREGRFHLRCNIYHRHTLIQSRLVAAQVRQEPEPQVRALQSTLDYTLSNTLGAPHLSQLEPHRLSWMVNSNGDGTHNFHFLGEQDFKNSATFDGQELQDLIEQARQALRRAAWGDIGPWSKGKDYRYDGPRDVDRLKTDLIRLAIQGFRFYFVLGRRLAGGLAQLRSLDELMRQTGLVQIAFKQSPRHILPAAMIYDYTLETNIPFEDYELCEAFGEALEAEAPLEESRCFQGDCPSRGQETVVCPSGFWGYRHNLGLPVSIAGAPDVPTTLSYEEAPQFTVNVSTDPDFTLREAHEQALQALTPKPGWHYADTREEVRQLLTGTQPHIVYFYCHGGVSGSMPYLLCGPPDARGITPDNLFAWKVQWDAPRPLVFINGCHTTALEPEEALHFVSSFVELAQASGVIGTEITVFEPLASAFAEACLRRFLAGEPIGAAVRKSRLKLLKDGNPLGLVYIPYVMADLKLSQKRADQ
jgi:hypothetical protein